MYHHSILSNISPAPKAFNWCISCVNKASSGRVPPLRRNKNQILFVNKLGSCYLFRIHSLFSALVPHIFLPSFQSLFLPVVNLYITITLPHIFPYKRHEYGAIILLGLPHFYIFPVHHCTIYSFDWAGQWKALTNTIAWWNQNQKNLRSSSSCM